ncbi:hypothetical protein TNCV_888201 [Trichonephila clavipes]|nr:hypothetical protein TNCV_888201 [Trichonephila clavipes]
MSRDNQRRHIRRRKRLFPPPPSSLLENRTRTAIQFRFRLPLPCAAREEKPVQYFFRVATLAVRSGVSLVARAELQTSCCAPRESLRLQCGFKLQRLYRRRVILYLFSPVHYVRF